MPYLQLSRGRQTVLRFPHVDEQANDEHALIFGPYRTIQGRAGEAIELQGEEDERLSLIHGLVYYAGTYYAEWSAFTGPLLPEEEAQLVLFDPAQADPPDPLVPCECELPGEFNSGVPGILAHFVDGHVSPDFRVERCDICRRYPSDAAAQRKLYELGLAEGPDPNLPTFTVECHAVVRVTVRDVPAADLRAAAREARAMFDWYRFRKDAMFDGEFRRFIVTPESVLPGEARIRPTRQFHSELIDLQLPA